jgi:hypothetical protein
MIVGLDSATPPTAAQAAAARAAGVAVWSGYLATRPELGVGPGGSRFGLFRPWRQVEFAPVKTLHGTPLAYASGWDDPAGCKALAAAWGVRLCLDVEGGIRGDGAWVQGWLDGSGAGLYGTRYVHTPQSGAARRAPFHIAAWYTQERDPHTGQMVAFDPQATWPAGWPHPMTPVGWQWQNTHAEFGVGVDRCWFDDWFAQGATGGPELMTDSERKAWVFDGFMELFGRNPNSEAELAAIVNVVKPDRTNLYEIRVSMWNDPRAQAHRAAQAGGGKPGPFDATITPHA